MCGGGGGDGKAQKEITNKGNKIQKKKKERLPVEHRAGATT